jgi:hypothetical protein
VSEGVAALSELAAAGVEADDEDQVAESIWVTYGHTSYDGEVLVAESRSLPWPPNAIAGFTAESPKPARCVCYGAET